MWFNKTVKDERCVHMISLTLIALLCIYVCAPRVCVYTCVHTFKCLCVSFAAFQFVDTGLAINITNGYGLSNEVHRDVSYYKLML